MTPVLAGLIAGAFGTLAMSGLAATARRVVEPTAVFGETHYERVAVAVTALARRRAPAPAVADPDTVLDLPARRRMGEALHMLFGMITAVPLALVVDAAGRSATAVDGAVLAAILWVFGFLGYLPLLGVTAGPRSMTRFEVARTMTSHLTFGVTTALVLAALTA